MEVTLIDVEHIMRPNARAGLPVSYTRGTISVIANDQFELSEMVQAMQSWANGTFEPVVMERPDPDGPLIVSSVEVSTEEPDVDDLDIDLITGSIE